MKKILLPLFSLLLSWCISAYAQETMLESFDNLGADTLYQYLKEGNSYLNFAENSTDKMQGLASLDVHAYLDSVHSWGTYAMFTYRLPTGATPMDWSSSDTLRLWIKVVKAPVYPQYMSFRIQLRDKGATGTDQMETYIYQNDIILDSAMDWYQLKIPLHEINSQGRTVSPGDSGFVEAPGNWGGFSYNDDKLNIDKLVGWNIVFVTTTTSLNPNPPAGFTNVPADSLEVRLDGFDRTGNKPVPFVIFNGIAIPAQLGTPWAWGDASISVAEGAGPVPNSNALKWVMGDQYGSGFCGFGFTFTSPVNLSGSWQTDSLKFMMKTDAVGDSMRAQFENGVGKVGVVFNAANDTLWHQYSLALRDMKPTDNTTGFDPSNVNTFGIMTQNDSALGITGKIAYVTNVWTGNPKIDVIPPQAPTGITVIANSDNTNTIIWSDVPDQQNETYNIYYSLNPITDITASGVEVAATGIVHGTDISVHKLIAPGADQNVSYYYAVVCRSGAGILGNPGATGVATTNMAKGVTTISQQAPPNFQADGDISEWTSAGIKPFRLYPSDNSGTVVPGSKIASDTVSSGDVYVAVDQNYLYVAGHINTNNIVFTASQSSWLNTATDLFLGLYNWHGASHTSLLSGAKPDYHFRFAQDRVIIDNDGVDSLTIPGQNYFWGPRFPDPFAGYNFEAKISWTDIAHKANGGNTRTDNVFAPQVGMRIPFDIEIGSCSPGATSRDGQLDYSSIANGNSYSNVSLWTNTWIGNEWNVTAVNNNKQTVYTYELNQNYPNPFNPTTTIQYSLKSSGKVVLKVYDILGREVTTLVNQNQGAGNYRINFDASKLSSGVYFYQIEAGSFRTVKKMMLLK